MLLDVYAHFMPTELTGFANALAEPSPGVAIRRQPETTPNSLEARKNENPSKTEAFSGGPVGARTRDRRIKSPHSRNPDSRDTSRTWSGNWPAMLRRTPPPDPVARINLKCPVGLGRLEHETRFELATLTLAREFGPEEIQ